jgi:DNA polymerase-3 subunit delta'
MSATPLTVAPGGALPLPWLGTPLAQALAGQRGHALLIHGSEGVGALHFALALAQAGLCEDPQPVPAGQTPSTADATTDTPARWPCGTCGSCRLVQARLHPDLLVLMPEERRRRLEWPWPGDRSDGAEEKKKPSRQIRIDEVRAVIDWAFKTSARGRGKQVVLHPAETLNLQSANALLKTLEEPPLGTRLLLVTADPALLLPTVRSRCQHLQLPAPPADVALPWLAAQGLAQAETLLAACSGRPLDALALAAAGVDAAAWARLPAAVARGETAALAGWPVPQVLDALFKLCHDALALQAGAAPRFFPAASLPAAAGPARTAALWQWRQTLARVARHDQHPWNEPLLLDSVVAAGREAFATGRAGQGLSPRPARQAV